ncbi:DUF1232 domain-containing protein [Pseudoalteromonas sp. T1lg75]|uniref:DUF1232 domain-containing protein n=1 Tax=Pseudoalteromonas sp. T1lg75 TaxID=2077102 RepID=UPI000CF6AE6E|nr:DUF1232 domain-containing protein [Pseudoalteromonas sp. T1lg75]
MNKRTYTPEHHKALKRHGENTAPSWLYAWVHATLTRTLHLYYAISSERCTQLHRLALAVTLVYVAFPYDLLPDSSSVLGLLDDTLLLTSAAISLLGYIDARVKVIAGLQAHQLLLKVRSVPKC